MSNSSSNSDSNIPKIHNPGLILKDNNSVKSPLIYKQQQQQQPQLTYSSLSQNVIPSLSSLPFLSQNQNQSNQLAAQNLHNIPSQQPILPQQVSQVGQHIHPDQTNQQVVGQARPLNPAQPKIQGGDYMYNIPQILNTSIGTRYPYHTNQVYSVNNNEQGNRIISNLTSKQSHQSTTTIPSAVNPPTSNESFLSISNLVYPSDIPSFQNIPQQHEIEEYGRNSPTIKRRRSTRFINQDQSQISHTHTIQNSPIQTYNESFNQQESSSSSSAKKSGKTLKWTIEDDKLIIHYKETLNYSWKKISKLIHDRHTWQAIQMRYLRCLKDRNAIWSPQEELKLIQVLKEDWENRWKRISVALGPSFSNERCINKIQSLTKIINGEDGEQCDKDLVNSLSDEQIRLLLKYNGDYDDMP